MTFFCEKVSGAKNRMPARIKIKFRMMFISTKHKNKDQNAEALNFRMLKILTQKIL